METTVDGTARTTAGGAAGEGRAPLGMDLEQKVEATARSLFSLMDQSKSSLLSQERWQQEMMDWAMADERLKVELFRFVDVFPTLTSRAEIDRHLARILRPTRPRSPASAQGRPRRRQERRRLTAGDGLHPAPDARLRAALHHRPRRARLHAGAARPAAQAHGLHPRCAGRGHGEREGGGRLPATLPRAARRARRGGPQLEPRRRHRRGRLGRAAARQRVAQDHLALLADRSPELPRQRRGDQGAAAAHLPQGHRDRRLRQPRPRAVPLPRPHLHDLHRAPRRGGVPRLRPGRRRRAGVSARRRGRPARRHRLGARARPRRHRAPREGGLLGLRDGARRPGGLAGAGVHAQARQRRDVRAPDAHHARASRTRYARRSAATTCARWRT